MSKLFTFGCSFTEDFKHFVDIGNIKTNTRTKYIHEFCGGVPPDCWTDVLGKLLNYDINNFGANNAQYSNLIPDQSGNSNDHIFNNFCHMVNHINEGDVVIIQWTYMERFLWVDDINNRPVSILPNQYSLVKNEELMNQILLNKSHHLWIDQLFIKEKLINEIAKVKKFKVFYWSIDVNFYKLKSEIIKNNSHYLFINKLSDFRDVIDMIYKKGGQSITFETNNKIEDSHFGKNAHKILGELIYDDIKNKL